VDIRLFNLPVNSGKGAALHKGIELATATSSLSRMPTLNTTPGNTTFSLNLCWTVCRCGLRITVHGWQPPPDPGFSGILSKPVPHFLSNMFTNLNLTIWKPAISSSGPKIIKKIYFNEKSLVSNRKSLQRSQDLKESGFYEVGISYYGRTYEEGKKSG